MNREARLRLIATLVLDVADEDVPAVHAMLVTSRNKRDFVERLPYELAHSVCSVFVSGLLSVGALIRITAELQHFLQ